ncbi:MAG: hypothetical protein CM1200mP27_03360 [Chloroflexota bacterium]|nr:MAG: hypothetical protein CM1200mP27_03360 [Chloroflexota bacterium]
MARHAQGLGANGTPIERALLDALVHRYQSPKDQETAELLRWNDVYASAMRGVYAQFPATSMCRIVCGSDDEPHPLALLGSRNRKAV